MAQRSHVPKFGDWDSDNVPYTTYFEVARKEKASGVRMNPNDPVENPAAFMCIEGSLESKGGGRAPKPPHHVSSDKSMPDENHHNIEGHTRRNAHRRPPSDQNSGSRKSITSESGSDKSNSDYSLLQAKHRRLKSDRQKSLVESSNSFSPSLAGPAKQKSVNQPRIDPQRAASVPKFGEWDEKDPRSGEGFTVIFNKVKEEKQIATTTFPAVPQQPSNYSNSQKKRRGSSLGSKICCCFSSSES